MEGRFTALELFYNDWPIWDEYGQPQHNYEPLSPVADDACRLCCEGVWVHPDWPERRAEIIAELREIGDSL